MATKAKTTTDGRTVVSENRRARREYFIEETLEAGLELKGSEVKSLRRSGAQIAEAYASSEEDQLFLVNAHIAPLEEASYFNHEARRRRRLLVHRKQLDKLSAAVDREGMTLIPLELYFNERGLAKLAIGLAKGKKLHDKRESDRKRDWERQKARLMREKG
ncbi:MAG: SsrA-binding protein SmpB [Pseudomonadota bacterium]